MKNIFKTFALMMCLAAMLSACKGTSTKPLLPNVSGKAGEVVVVIDKTAWDGALGTLVRENLACDCPYLPFREPLYSLVNVAPRAFTNIFQIHRNIIIFNIDPQLTKEGIKLRNDVWARPQAVIQINAFDNESAVKIATENMAKIIAFVEQAERDRVIANAKLYEERALRPQVMEIFGGSPVFPIGYQLKKKTSDFVWIGYETTFVYQDILIYKYPATRSEADFSAKNIIDNRNRTLKENVPGMFENTYMTTGTFMEPEVTYMKYKGRDFAQTRGLWEVENDYMGGPFVSPSFYSPDGQDIIVVEAFVYAPKYEKRQYLRQTESLLYSFEWAAVKENQK
ncbi:MAG: DUF4837 family protein [Bacteroidales bacterium]|nr:DUF4837 family protein [Bacteroidales bacterium]